MIVLIMNYDLFRKGKGGRGLTLVFCFMEDTLAYGKMIPKSVLCSFYPEKFLSDDDDCWFQRPTCLRRRWMNEENIP